MSGVWIFGRILAQWGARYAGYARKVLAAWRGVLAAGRPYLKSMAPVLLPAFVLGLGLAIGVQAGRHKPLDSPVSVDAPARQEDHVPAAETLRTPEHPVGPGGTQESSGRRAPDPLRWEEARVADYRWMTAADGALFQSSASRGEGRLRTGADFSPPVGGPEAGDLTAPEPDGNPRSFAGEIVTIDQLTFEWPVRGWISSSYGPRDGRIHYGIDIAAPLGAPVKASEHGRVIFAGWYGSYGETVIVRHGPDIVSLYAHLSSATAKAGQMVARGTQVGRCGNTGHSKGPHLHFEIRINGRPVDPLPFLD